MSNPLLQATNLHKTYRLGRVDVPVLRGCDVDVQHGEFWPSEDQVDLERAPCCICLEDLTAPTQTKAMSFTMAAACYRFEIGRLIDTELAQLGLSSSSTTCCQN